MGGGASQQFATVPMNFLRAGATADYVDGGEWGTKAIKAAKGLGTVDVAASSAATNMPPCRGTSSGRRARPTPT